MIFSSDKKLIIEINNETANGHFQLFHVEPRKDFLIQDYLNFFSLYFLEFGRLLENRAKSEDKEFTRNRKFWGLLHGRMVKRSDKGDIVDSFDHWFHRNALSLPTDASGDYSTLMNLMADDISRDINTYSTAKSGWIFERVLEFKIKITRYRLASNRGARSTVPSIPKTIPKRALVIVHRSSQRNGKNISVNCFLDAITIACFIQFWELLYKMEFKMPFHSSYPSTWLKLISEADFKLNIDKSLREETYVEAFDCYRFENSNPQYFVTIIGTDGKTGFHTIRTYNRDRLNIYQSHEIRKQKPPLFVNILLFKEHYFPIKSVTTLFRHQNRHAYYCNMCLHQFRHSETLEIHKIHCNGLSMRRITMPKPGSTLDFNKYRNNSQHHPVVIYADAETFHAKDNLPQNTSRIIIDKHVPIMIAYYIAFSKDFRAVLDRASNNINQFPILTTHDKVLQFEDYPNNLYKVFYGENCIEEFLTSLFDVSERLGEFMSRIKMKYCYQESKYKELMKTEKVCHICKRPIDETNENLKPVLDHDHWTGKFRGIAHRACNLILQQRKRFFPIIFHNFKSYDSHLLCRYAKFSKKEDLRIGVIPTSSEKYLSLSLKWKIGEFVTTKLDEDGNAFEKTISLKNELRFIDSYQFLSVKLETLIQQLESDELFYHTKLNFPAVDIFNLAKRKGVYPYTYVDSYDKMNETSLPSREAFKSGDQDISNEDYLFAKKVWKTVGCETLKDYTRFYLKVDVFSLADVFENFRKNCLESFNQDPIFYFSLPGLSWAVMLRTTSIEFELICDYEMHCFIESGIRGGLTQCTKNYSEADNIYTNPDAHMSANDFSKYLYLLDANGLYSWALSQPLPYKNFKWIDDQHVLEQLFLRGIENFPDVMGESGYILMVDLEYPASIHNLTSSYPLAPSKESIEVTDYSFYMLQQWERTHPPNFKINAESKLLATCGDKENYVVHFRTLQFYLKMGLRIKRIKRAISFHQKPFMKVFIESNIQERRKWSNNKAKSDFYKLLNNSVYGKTVESQRKYKNLKLSSNEQEMLSLVGKNTFQGSTVISNDLVVFNMMREKVELNKPIYVGMSVLDLSKLLMFRFFYDVIQPTFTDASVLYTDTDSLLLEICEENIERKMSSLKKDWLDGSNLPTDHILFSNENKGKLGFFKDEMDGSYIEKAILLRPKMYCLTCTNSNVKLKAKGIQNKFVKNNFSFETYHTAYLKSLEANQNNNSENAQLTNLRSTVKFQTFLSKRHEIYTIEQEKSSLMLFDNKRYWTKINHSLPLFHWQAKDEHERSFEKRKSLVLKRHKFNISESKHLKTELAPYKYRDEYNETRKRKHPTHSITSKENMESNSDDESDEVYDEYENEDNSFIDDSDAQFLPSTSKRPRFNTFFDSEATC